MGRSAHLSSGTAEIPVYVLRQPLVIEPGRHLPCEPLRLLAQLLRCGLCQDEWLYTAALPVCC